MREIKFRQPLLDNNDKCYAFHYWGFIDGRYVPPMFPATTATKRGDDQQYTGLKDKNGKEIYEGCIMSPRAHLKKYGNQLVKYVCEPTCSGFVMSGDLMFDECEEVIGNVYQNPELLEVKDANSNS